jgi:hypothetical protein
VPRRTWTVLALVLIPCGIGFWIRHLAGDTHTALLIGERGARWIVRDQPFELRAKRPENVVVWFRKRFVLTAPVSDPDLVVRAFRGVELLLDGRSIFRDPLTGADDWKRARSIALDRTLIPGPHELRARVANASGPPALFLRSDALGLRSDADWEVWVRGVVWAPARLAATPRPPALSREFAPAPAELWQQMPVVAAIFAAAFCATLWVGRHSTPRLAGTAGAVRWLVLLAWAALGANNLLRLPGNVGYDVGGHFAYIRWIADGRGIPLATDGWQMFQSPLYYLVSAPVHLVLSRFVDVGRMRQLLRIVPFAAGAAQVQLAYVALRRTFPAREDLQAIGTAFAGLLPINLYMAQNLGNESMAGCLSGAVLVCGLGFLDASAAPTMRTLLTAGVLLGLALLTKVSAILVVPPLVGAMAYARRNDARPLRSAARDASIVLTTALVVAGWYYARNWLRLGRPFVAGWDSGRGITWWQDPGYRTPAEFLRFGESLVHPLLAGVASFWDAVYSTLWSDALLSGADRYGDIPPWNYGYLAASVELALVPTALLVAGAVAAFVRQRPALLFAATAIALQAAALLNLYVQVPVYSIGKAHYTLGGLVCYAILLAAGLECLGNNLVLRALLCGALAAWGFTAYATYFVVG